MNADERRSGNCDNLAVMEQRGRRAYNHSGMTAEIIKAYYQMYNDLGCGFLGKVYENALAIELRNCGRVVIQQAPIHAHNHGAVVGDYFATWWRTIS